MKRILISAALLLGAVAHAQNPAEAAQREARFQQLWSAADAVHRQDRYADSEQLYKDILAEFPKSQRTALRIAIAQAKTDKRAEALASYDRAIALDPNGSWAPVALFYKARNAKEWGDAEAARAAIARLRATHPDSPYAARMALLEAELAGTGVEQAQAALDRELAAAERFEAAKQLSAEGRDDEAIEALARLVEADADTATALGALEQRAHILTRNKRFEEAQIDFGRILARVARDAPHSRIAQVTKSRLGALAHVAEDRESALQFYGEVIRESPSNALAENAALQSAGIVFEILQRDVFAGTPPTTERWGELVSQLDTILEEAEPHGIAYARGLLMKLEVAAWRLRIDEMELVASLFFEKVNPDSYPVEHATAHYFMGRRLKGRYRFAEAREHSLKAIAISEPGNEIWQGLDLLQRCYFDAFECSVAIEDIESAERLREELRTGFPESAFLELMDTDNISYRLRTWQSYSKERRTR